MRRVLPLSVQYMMEFSNKLWINHLDLVDDLFGYSFGSKRNDVRKRMTRRKIMAWHMYEYACRIFITLHSFVMWYFFFLNATYWLPGTKLKALSNAFSLKYISLRRMCQILADNTLDSQTHSRCGIHISKTSNVKYYKNSRLFFNHFPYMWLTQWLTNLEFSDYSKSPWYESFQEFSHAFTDKFDNGISCKNAPNPTGSMWLTLYKKELSISYQ